MKYKSVIICSLILLFSACTKNHSIGTPKSILISSAKTPANIVEISDVKIIKKFVDIFDVNEEVYLGEESSFHSTGLIDVTFKYENHIVRYTVYEKEIPGSYSYFKDLDSNAAYKISDEAYRLIESYLP